MTDSLGMTVLIDNIAKGILAGEWGLSILIEAGEKNILLDTGADGQFAENARKLGIDLEEVDFAVLSHAHYDHADGMDAFFAQNDRAPLYLREGSGENCYGMKEGEPRYIGICRGALERNAGRIRYVSGVCEIGDGIWLVPHRSADYTKIALRSDLYVMRDGKRVPDDFAHEQSLVIETEKGLAVFNSCSHAGMPNILEDVRQLLGRDDVYAYVGGLHLFKLDDDEVREICAQIKESRVREIYTGHCTGDGAFAILKEGLGERVCQIFSGFSCRL